jgi:hypothetical protein
MKPSAPGDVFTYTATAPTYNADNAKADGEKINVFPNPYYGMNSREWNRLNKYVKFNHLPGNATIRIFNLAGVLVRTIQKTPDMGQFATWNLRNERAIPVASGHRKSKDLKTCTCSRRTSFTNILTYVYDCELSPHIL